MMKKNLAIICGVVVLVVVISACANMAAVSINETNVVGRDVDEVLLELQTKGLSCGPKGSTKAFPTNRLVGSVGCNIREKFSLVCPTSFGVYLGYELSTNKVTSILKGESNNCF